jgi:hypothetical protein
LERTLSALNYLPGLYQSFSVLEDLPRPFRGQRRAAADERRFAPGAAQELLGILNEPQPRGCEFLNGKIASVSFEKMTVYVFRLGTKPTIKLEAVQKHGNRLATRTPKGKAPVAANTKRLASLKAGQESSYRCQPC